MQYEDVFRSVLAAFPDVAVVSTCGHISRDLFNASDREGNFYLVGSMGMAAPVGAGIGWARPDRLVVIFDGDGSLAMNVGGMLSVAETRARILHVVLDNGGHGSTGGQGVVKFVDPVSTALAMGYQQGVNVDRANFDWTTVTRFPAFAHAKVQPRDRPVGGRVSHTPYELRDRFRRFLAQP